ncbi:MAG: helix-turn-helix domain-containing protein [Bacteroidales bacterium]|nr:helix-turn-helix domain-containing protein [Bacteroidales bacterium]
MDSKTIGDIVKFHRKKAGLNQKGLAELAGVGKTVIFDIEKGKETIKYKTLINVLHVLNIKIELKSPLMSLSNQENYEKI